MLWSAGLNVNPPAALDLPQWIMAARDVGFPIVVSLVLLWVLVQHIIPMQQKLARLLGLLEGLLVSQKRSGGKEAKT